MADFSEFEDLLRDQPLRAPPADLDRRVEAAIGQPPAVRRRARRRNWAVLAALATTVAAVIVVLHWRSGPSPEPQVADIEPDVKIEQIWSAVVESRVISEEGDPAAERQQRQIVRHVRWIDDHNQVEIEWNIPSRQSAVVPLEYN